MAIDPVCGMTVEPAKAAGKLDYKGTSYFFCSKHCLHSFQSDPGKFLLSPKREKTEEKETQEPQGKAKYTCPMHPQIVRDAPGSCPICGMALVPIAGTGEADDSELRDLTRRFWVGAVLSVPLVLLAMAPMAGIMEPFGLAPRTRGWVELLLGTPAALWVGWPILKKFWLSLANWSLNMY